MRSYQSEQSGRGWRANVVLFKLRHFQVVLFVNRGSECCECPSATCERAFTCRTPAAWSGPWTPRPAARPPPSAGGTSAEVCTPPGKTVKNPPEDSESGRKLKKQKLTSTSRRALAPLSFLWKNSSSCHTSINQSGDASPATSSLTLATLTTI